MHQIITNRRSRRSDGRTEDDGFTLVEILIAIVLVGILSAVVIVGIGRLTEDGANSACKASLDASKAGSVSYFASTGAYPTNFAALTEAKGNPYLVLPSEAEIDPENELAIKQGDNWTLTMSKPDGNQAPTFTCD